MKPSKRRQRSGHLTPERIATIRTLVALILEIVERLRHQGWF